MKPFLWLTLLFCAARCFAMDITTLDGTFYRDVKVTRVDADGLVITHVGGAGKIEFLNLPEEVRKKYAFDPAKAEAAKKAVEAAKKAAATGWQEMDQRMVFLTVQLSSVEASLAALNRVLVSLGIQQAFRQHDAATARQSNENMDRYGGGPVPWSEFYGRTAEKFFYHPTDKNTSYHTLTVLGQTPASEDVAPATGVPSRQGLPVAQRPPQFDYIYRANAEAEKRAQEEVARLGNNVEAIQARRRQLEVEQSALWSKIAFHAVAGRELLAKPLYFYDLKNAGPNTDEGRQRLEALRAALDYLRNGNKLAAMVEEGVEADAAQCYSQLQKGVDVARGEMQRRLMAQPLVTGDITDSRTLLGRFVAVTKRMSEVSANINDAHRLALDGDRAADQSRKLTFRSQLQQSLMLCAEALLAGDECVTDLAREWKVQPAVQTTAAPASAAVQQSLVVPAQRPVETLPVKPSGPTPTPAVITPTLKVPAEVQELFTPEFAALPVDERCQRVTAKLKQLNPGLAGDIKYKKGNSEVTEIEFNGTGVANIWPLRALVNLRVAKFGCHWRPNDSSLVADLSPLRGLQLVVLDCGHSKVGDLSPLAGMPLVELACNGSQVSDLSPLRGMKLTSLNCGNTRVRDLSPLAGMPLQSLKCFHCPVSDLSPLRGMKLTEFSCGNKVVDLSPLAGMPLQSFWCNDSHVSDLSPLRGMKLTEFYCSNSKVKDLSPLNGMPLERLAINRTSIADLTPFVGMPLYFLKFDGTQVTDFSPLKEMKSLHVLFCDFKPERDSAILRSIKTLERINDQPVAEFWKGVDAGKSP